MSTFVVWDKKDDTEARGFFKNITGVAVQQHPLVNEQETHYMVGHKMTLQQYQALNETELFTVKNHTPPTWWVQKQEEVIE